MLTEEETDRYSRHLLLTELGMDGQEKLKNSRVLVIGAGGLGCPVLMYLTAAGIGKIGIIDFDKVDITNLQRQVLFDQTDVGKFKSVVASHKLSRQNPYIDIKSVNIRLTTSNALEIFSEYDIVVDGTDNFSTRYLVNDACVLLGKTLVSGSIFKFQGQLSVFNYKDGKLNYGPTYRCLFPSPPQAGSAPSCSEIGVLGVLPGTIGTLMANEVIKIVTGIGEVLSGKLLLFDSLSMNFQTVDFSRNPEAMRSAPQSADSFRKTDYDFFCGIGKNDSEVREVLPVELFSMISSRETIQLLDVRERYERPVVSILDDLRIPLGKIDSEASRIARDKKVVIFCQSGARSRKAIELLSGKYGFNNLYSLKGGVTNWMRTFNEKQE